MLRNFGLLVGGETIEEAFWMAHNVMTGVSTQVAGSCIFFVYVWRCNECVCVCVQTLHLSVCMCLCI